MSELKKYKSKKVYIIGGIFCGSKAEIMQIRNVNEVIVRLIGDSPITICIPLRLCTTNRRGHKLYLEGDIFREKREYAYDIVEKALRERDMEELIPKITIWHRSYNCFRYGLRGYCTYKFDSDLIEKHNYTYFHEIRINIALDKPLYCIKHCTLHEVVHLIEKYKYDYTNDNPHTKRFYKIGNDIFPTFEKDEKSLCGFCFMVLRMILWYKYNKKK